MTAVAIIMADPDGLCATEVTGPEIADRVLSQNEIIAGDFVLMLRGAKSDNLGPMLYVQRTTQGIVFVEYPDAAGALLCKCMLMSNVLHLDEGILGCCLRSGAVAVIRDPNVSDKELIDDIV